MAMASELEPKPGKLVALVALAIQSLCELSDSEVPHSKNYPITAVG